MTWTRVATAAVLIPVVVVLVLYTSTVVVAVATAIIALLALWEYFALGEAIGHRAYRLWTMFCAVLLVCSQWLESRSQEILGWPGPASYSLHRFFPAILELPSTVLFGAGDWEASAGAAYFAEENVGRGGGKHGGVAVGGGFFRSSVAPMGESAVGAHVFADVAIFDHGIFGEYCGADGGFAGVGVQ